MVVSIHVNLRIFALFVASILVVSDFANAAYEDPSITLYNFARTVHGKMAVVFFTDPPETKNIIFREKHWSKLEKKYKDDPDIKIVEVNCQEALGHQMCIDTKIDDTPEIWWGDSSFLEKYEGNGSYDIVVDFIENTVRKKRCSISHIDSCPEEEREAYKAIKEATKTYYTKIQDIRLHENKYRSDVLFSAIADQAIMKHGIKNPFRHDMDDLHEDDDDEEERTDLDFEGRPAEY